MYTDSKNQVTFQITTIIVSVLMIAMCGAGIAGMIASGFAWPAIVPAAIATVIVRNVLDAIRRLQRSDR